MSEIQMETLMNSARMRIMQFLIGHQQATTGQIQEHLHDIPQASLYRHVKKLEQAGFIEVIAERPVRGAVEKTYQLTKQEDVSAENIRAQIRFMFLYLLEIFERYFEVAHSEEAAIQSMMQDMLFVTTGTYLLTDEEFTTFMQEISAVVQKNLNNPPAPGRKPRSVYMISAPGDEQKHAPRKESDHA